MLTGVHPFYKLDSIIAALFVCGIFMNRIKDEQFAVGGTKRDMYLWIIEVDCLL